MGKIPQPVTRPKKGPRKMQLFRRLPRLHWEARADEPFIKPEEWGNYPTLVEDLKLLEEHLMPEFHILDNEALKEQNRFRLEQMILLVGSALAAILGAVQIALINSPVPGIVETLVTITLAAITYVARYSNAQKKYFTYRLATETLRGQYYLFLGRMENYTEADNRLNNLDAKVREIARLSGKVIHRAHT